MTEQEKFFLVINQLIEVIGFIILVVSGSILGSTLITAILFIIYSIYEDFKKINSKE